MGVHVYLDANDDLYVLWDGQLGIYQHIRQGGANAEVFQPPAGLELIYPTLHLDSELEDEYERGYEEGYDRGYDAGSEEGYEAGLEAERDR